MMITKDMKLEAWWADRGQQFPMLCRVARKYLSSHTTFTASDWLFSLAGKISVKKRNRLKPTNVDMYSCLAHNLKKNPTMLK